MEKLKSDKYRKSRGGYSRFLKIHCEKCNTLVCIYQKDGPGILKRMYVDRIYSSIKSEENNLICPKCNKTIGHLSIYEKENRPTYFLIPGRIIKKISKIN